MQVWNYYKIENNKKFDKSVESTDRIKLTLGGADTGDTGVVGGEIFGPGVVGLVGVLPAFFLFITGVLGCNSAAIKPSLSCTMCDAKIHNKINTTRKSNHASNPNVQTFWEIKLWISTVWYITFR